MDEMQKEAAEQEAEQEAALEAEQEAAEANPPNVRGPRDRARTEAERLRRLDHPRAASRGVPFRVSRTQRRDQQAELRLDRDTEAALRCSLSSSPGKTMNVVLWAAPAHPASPTPARSVPATDDVLWAAVEECAASNASSAQRAACSDRARRAWIRRRRRPCVEGEEGLA